MPERGASLEPVYTLKQAAEKFFPSGPLTAASLRNEIRKGRLRATMPAGKLLVTESALIEMLESCRVNVCRPTSSSKSVGRLDEMFGGSETERIAKAQAALKTIFEGRSRR